MGTYRGKGLLKDMEIWGERLALFVDQLSTS